MFSREINLIEKGGFLLEFYPAVYNRISYCNSNPLFVPPIKNKKTINPNLIKSPNSSAIAI